MPAVGARFAHNQEAKRVEVDAGGERLGIGIAENYTRTETVEVDPKYSWMKTRTFSYHFNHAIEGSRTEMQARETQLL